MMTPPAPPPSDPSLDPPTPLLRLTPGTEGRDSPDPDPALLVPPQHAPSLLSLPPPLHPGPLFLIV